jgi:hypothetical protein
VVGSGDVREGAIWQVYHKEAMLRVGSQERGRGCLESLSVTPQTDKSGTTSPTCTLIVS